MLGVTVTHVFPHLLKGRLRAWPVPGPFCIRRVGGIRAFLQSMPSGVGQPEGEHGSASAAFLI